MQNTEITPAPFTEAQIRQLLSAYAEQSGVQLAPSTDDWAADIWQRTRGHRGLTILCGTHIQELNSYGVLASEGPVPLDTWRAYADTTLPDVARKRPAVRRMLLDLQRELNVWFVREQRLELLEMVCPSLTRIISHLQISCRVKSLQQSVMQMRTRKEPFTPHGHAMAVCEAA